MIAPFAVEPFARPTIPPMAAPDAAPMIAPASFLFNDAHPLAETTVASAGMRNNERCIMNSWHEVTSVDEHTRLGDTGFALADASIAGVGCGNAGMRSVSSRASAASRGICTSRFGICAEQFHAEHAESRRTRRGGLPLAAGALRCAPPLHS